MFPPTPVCINLVPIRVAQPDPIVHEMAVWLVSFNTSSSAVIVLKSYGIDELLIFFNILFSHVRRACGLDPSCSILHSSY